MIKKTFFDLHVKIGEAYVRKFYGLSRSWKDRKRVIQEVSSSARLSYFFCKRLEVLYKCQDLEDLSAWLEDCENPYETFSNKTI